MGPSIAFVQELRPVTPADERRVHELPARDVAGYDRDPHKWFSASQLKQMYEANPRWATLEHELYGDLLI